MRLSLNCGAFLIMALFSFSLFAQAQVGFKETVQGPMTLKWKLQKDKIEFIMSAKTKGWVAIGIGKTEKMKDADIVIGSVKGSKVTVEDHYANSGSRHEKKSATNLEAISGKWDEKTGITEIHFTRNVKATSDKGVTINPAGDNIIMLAYGNAPRFSKVHDGLVVISKFNFTTGKLDGVKKIK